MATLSLRHAAVTCSRGPKGMKVWQLPFATPNYLYDDKITIFPMTPERYISLQFRLGRVWGGILLVMMTMMILPGPGDGV